MYQFIAGLASDIAADRLTVHTDTLAGYLEKAYLIACNMLEAQLHKVYASSFLIIADTATEQVIGVYRWSHIRQKFQAEGLSGKKVKLALLKQILVTATESFLQNQHCYEYAD